MSVNIYIYNILYNRYYNSKIIIHSKLVFLFLIFFNFQNFHIFKILQFFISHLKYKILRVTIHDIVDKLHHK